MYYFLDISRDEVTASDSETIAYVYGDLDTISYVGKRALKLMAEDTRQFSVRLVETDKLGPNSEDKRTVTELTSDGDTVALVLKKKLAAERSNKPSAPVQPSQPQPESLPAQDVIV